MPEGPEVRIEADRIAKALVGQPLDAVELTQPRLAHRADELLGAVVTTVAPHGKAMLITFANGLTLYSHNQLYGRWYVRKRASYPKTRRTLRVGLHAIKHSALLYSASDIDLLDANALATHPFLSRLGPDILDPALTPEAILLRLLDPRFSGRSLAALYLDQGFLAGVGNYLRSEILFFAGVHPQDRPRDLPDSALIRIAEQTHAVCQQAYCTRGITARTALVGTLKAEGYGREAYRFMAFARDGRLCHDCGSIIERASMSGRRIYICPTCQPKQRD